METVTNKQRLIMADLMDFLVDHKNKVHYAQIRPMGTNKIRSISQLKRLCTIGKGIIMDCSESVTLICRLSGLRDPNGMHYNGTGWTETLLRYLPHYENPAVAGIGALFVFGVTDVTPGGKHVCMSRQHGQTNPILFSHGCEADPSYYTLDVMKQAFDGQEPIILNISHLGFGKAVK